MLDVPRAEFARHGEDQRQHLRLVRSLAKYAAADTKTGTFWFAKNFALYWASLGGIFAFDPIAAKLALAIAAGVALAGFIVLGHDAAHGALVADKRLNRFLAVVSFAHTLHNYRLWIYDHHVLHHRMTNGPHKGTYTPYSPAEFAHLGRLRQFLERFYRSPNLVGAGVHYLIERWWPALLFPRSAVPVPARNLAWLHSAGIAGYFAALACAVAAAASAYQMSYGCAFLLAIVIPYCVANLMIGLVEFAQHTHPAVPWTKDAGDREFFSRPELRSVHIETPAWLSYLLMHVLEHPAHHLLPKIPCYRLREAQAELDRLLGASVVRSPLCLQWYLRTMRSCKLFDFQARAWVGFDAARV